MYIAQFGKRVSPATPLNPEAKERNGTRTLCEPRKQSEPTITTTLSIMKFALSVIALYVVASMVPRAIPLHQDVSEAIRKFVLDVTKNDHTWAKHLHVGIKINPENLAASPREVLKYLDDNKVLLKVNHDMEKMQDVEQNVREEALGKKGEVWVARALHIVVEVATRHNENDMALEFAVKSIVKAIECKMLMYILVIMDSTDEANTINTPGLSSIRESLIHILNKVAVIKKSIKGESELYQQFYIEYGADTEKLPNFKVFRTLVQKKLNDKCELNTLESIRRHVEPEIPNESEKLDDYCQKKLKEMFNQLPINTMNLKLWTRLLNAKDIEPNELDKNTV